MERSLSATWLPAGSQKPPRDQPHPPTQPHPPAPPPTPPPFPRGALGGTGLCHRHAQEKERGSAGSGVGSPPAPAPGCPSSFPVAAFVDGPPLDCRCSVQGRAAGAGSHTHSRRGPTPRGPPAHVDGGGGGNGAPFGVPALQARGDLGEGGAESEGQALDIPLMEAQAPFDVTPPRAH